MNRRGYRPRSRTPEQHGKRAIGGGDPPKKIINAIAGGFNGGEVSYSSRKRHIRNLHSINIFGRKKTMSPITITDEDFQGIDPG